MRVGFGPFHRDQRGAAPLAANAHALNEAHNGQDDRAPYADRGIAWHEADGEGRQARQQQRRDQRHLAPDAVAVMAEQRRAEWAGYEAYGIDAEGLQGPDQRIG